jgi:NitT/TauT family transport system substrate-binding protein
MKVATSMILGVVALAIGAAPAVAATKITLMFTGFSGFAGAFVAKDQGFFDKRGLDVDLVLAQNGSIMVAALVADSAQIAGPTPTVLLQAVESGIDLVVLAATSVLPGRDAAGLLARTGSDIKAAKDLAGKTVGVPGLGSGLDVMLRKWLMDEGVDVQKVRFVELSFPQMGDALKAKQVDAVATADPFYTRIVGGDIGYLVRDYTKDMPPGTLTSTYAALRSWVAANPEALLAFRDALAEAVAFAKANPDATRESIVRYLKLPPQIVATQSPPNLSVKVAPADMKLWIDLSLAQHLIKTPIEPETTVTPWP